MRRPSARACHDLTGGNPLYLREVVAAEGAPLEADRLRLVAQHGGAGTTTSIGPDPASLSRAPGVAARSAA
jgi:hypothetical protein